MLTASKRESGSKGRVGDRSKGRRDSSSGAEKSACGAAAATVGLLEGGMGGTSGVEKTAFGAAVTKDAVLECGIDGDGGAEGKGVDAAVSAGAPPGSAKADGAEAAATAPAVSRVAPPRVAEDGTGGMTVVENRLVVKGFSSASDESSDELGGESEVDVASLADVASVRDDEGGADGGENELNAPAVVLGTVVLVAELMSLQGVCACVEAFQAWGGMLFMFDFSDSSDIALANVKLTGALAPLGLGSGAIIGKKWDGKQRRRFREQWKKLGLKDARVMLNIGRGDDNQAWRCH